MGKTAIWAILCFYSLFPLNNVEKQRAKLASTHVIGKQIKIQDMALTRIRLVL